MDKELIKRYRKQKLTQLFIGILFIIGFYFYEDSGLIRIVMIILVLILGISHNAKLLTNVSLKNGYYIFETYSIVSKKEELKIADSNLIEILYSDNSHFSSHNLILKYNGKNGEIIKKLYLNAAPWSELMSKLIKIKIENQKVV